MGEEWLNTRTFLTDNAEKQMTSGMQASPFPGELQTEETLSPLFGLSCGSSHEHSTEGG